MNKFSYNILKSGSKGNAIIVENIFLFDCGVPYSTIKPYLKDIKLVFISHVHSDHINKSTIHTIAYNKPNIKFLVGEYLVDTLVKCDVQKKNILTIKENKWYNIGLAKVMIQELVHDVPNRCLHLEYKGKKLIYIVDTGEIPENIVAKNYDLFLIERNYESDEELDKQIQIANEQGIFTHLTRVKETHLSEVQAYDWILKNASDNSEIEYIHKHIEEVNLCTEETI